MSYEFKTASFSGPIEKLLELVEEKKLEITRVSLAEVTADFINFIKNLRNDFEPLMVADFLWTASKLVLIKSKSLIPSLKLDEEEEEDIHELEDRLRFYSGVREMKRGLEKIWFSFPVSFRREFSFPSARDFLGAPQNLNLENMALSLGGILKVLSSLNQKKESKKIGLVSLEEKTKEILESLRRCSLVLAQVLAGRPKSEAIVLFLAVLHLMKSGLAAAEQKGQFGDIVVSLKS